LAECREKAALGWGRYKHNQQLEELRNLQEQLQEERRLWQETRQDQQNQLQHKKETMAKLQVRSGLPMHIPKEGKKWRQMSFSGGGGG
jgi:predicted patatin/cPLA2 family phospholipase